jgi:NodT family efflux transporter outer membrane factor (OMF) lipoprotein
MKRKTALLTALSAFLTAACTVGPNYRRPTMPVPVAFKEPPPEGFKQAQPSDALQKGKWWEIYEDPALNALEEQVSVSNQSLIGAEAQFRQAKAAVLVARSGLYPTVTANASALEGQNAALNSNVVGRLGSTYLAAVTASWEPDLWGNIHRGITSAATTAQASFGDLENARLLFQSELAQDYFQLHGLDSEMDLLQRTASSYMEYLTLTRNRFAGGVASDLDVAQAESQLDSVQSSLIDLGVLRAQLEHAIAILTGKAPADLTIPTALLTAPPPPVPIAVPSELLERRPDIAASERRVASANEQIGIAMAAFYPTVALSASGGFESLSIASWFSFPSRIWSVGPTLAQTLFDAGRRKAVVAEQQAGYDATVAAYRQTVLTAFQQVEDNLAALRILEQEQAKVQETIQAANRALTVSTAQYRAGTTTYLTVITEQAALLSAEDTATQVLTRRLASSVGLIQALGGGWDASKMPGVEKVVSTSSN